MGRIVKIAGLVVGLVLAGFLAGFLVRLLIPAGRFSPEKR